MKIKIYYLDGRISEQDTAFMFNTGRIVKDEPYHSEVMLRADDLSDGLYVCCRASDITVHKNFPHHRAPVAAIRDLFDFQVITPDEMIEVGKVEVDGVPILWRVGHDGPLVNGVKFNIQADMFATTKSDMPINERACELWRALTGEDGTTPIIARKQHESQNDYERRVAKSMGWDYDCLYKFIQREKALLEESVEFIDEDNATEEEMGIQDSIDMEFDPITGEVYD